MFLPSQDKTGEFQETSVGKWFTYKPTQDVWALGHGFTHEVDVLDGVRYASLTKTSIQICVDEGADGTPEVERWKIKNHLEYTR